MIKYVYEAYTMGFTFLQGYKYHVMSLLPSVQTLDFSRVTKADRKTASTLEVMNKNVKRGKRKPKEED